MGIREYGVGESRFKFRQYTTNKNLRLKLFFNVPDVLLQLQQLLNFLAFLFVSRRILLRTPRHFLHLIFGEAAFAVCDPNLFGVPRGLVGRFHVQNAVCVHKKLD